MQQSGTAVRTAELRPNPVLELNTTLAAEQNRANGFSLTVPIDLSGRRDYRIRFAKETSLSVQFAYADALNKLLKNVKESYYTTQESEELCKIQREFEEIYRRLYELNQARLHEQQISGTEASRSFVAFRQEQLKREETCLERDRQKEHLRLLIGANEPITLLEPLKQSAYTPPSMQAIISRLEERPELQSLNHLILAAGADLNLQKARAYPETSAGFQGKYGNRTYAPGSTYGYPFQSYRDNEVGFFVQFTLPIFDRNQGEIERAALEEKRLLALKNLQKEKLLAEIRLAYKEYEAAQNALKQYGEGAENSILSRTGRSLESSRIAYSAGAISLLEYLDAVSVYAETRKSYAGAIARFNRAIAQIQELSTVIKDR